MELVVLQYLLLNQQLNQLQNQTHYLIFLHIHHFKVLIIFIHLLLQHYYTKNQLYNAFLIHQYNIYQYHRYRNNNRIFKHNNYLKDYNIIINFHFNLLSLDMTIRMLHPFIMNYNYIIFILLNQIYRNKNYLVCLSINITNVFHLLHMHLYNYLLLYIIYK